MKINIALQTKQSELDKAVEKFPFVLYGGAKGGGKSMGSRLINLKRRIMYPNSISVMFRRTYDELYGNHIRPLFKQFPDLMNQYYRKGERALYLPNGSIILFRFCRKESDADLHQGQEYHEIYIEEAGQWTETMFHRLKGSNRSTVPGVKPRMIMTANPGGVGHKWLKRLFISKQYDPEFDEKAEDYHFIPALVWDNPALMKTNPTYVSHLKAERNPALRKAYLDGSWDIFSGQFFDEIDRNIHCVKPFEIPHHWSRFAAYDYGFNHPAAIGWFAVDEDGNVYLYREKIEAKMMVDQAAKYINSFDDADKVRSAIYAGHDCWAKKCVGPTIREEFAKYKIYLKQANIDRINGASQVRSYLAWRNKPNKKPKFFIFNTCPISFECLTRMEHDPNRIEDVLKVDADQGDPYTGDDSYDMIRMGLMSRPITAKPQKPGWVDRYDDDDGPSGGEARSWKTA